DLMAKPSVELVFQRQRVVAVIVGEHGSLADDAGELPGAGPRDDHTRVGHSFGAHQPGVLKDEAARLPRERPADPVVADVASAALRLRDQQLRRALALEIAPEGARDVDAAHLGGLGVTIGLLVVAVVGEGRGGLHTSCPSASSTTSSWVF